MVDEAFKELIASDLPHGTSLLSDLEVNIKSVTGSINGFIEKVKDGEVNTAQGMSLLELKNQTFLSYLANLSHVVVQKLSGAKLEGSAAVERLVELRLVLERLRPLEDKLRYQIDKHVKFAASSNDENQDDPLLLKGNLDNIGSSSEDEDEDKAEEKKEKGKDKDRIYKVPKIVQTHYPGEESKNDAAEKTRKRLLNSSTLRDALYEHTEDPEVVYNTDTLKRKAIEERRKIETYEEDNFVRKQLSKRKRAELRAITTLGTMGSEILGFSNLDGLEGNSSGPPNKKKKTSKSKGKGKKGKGKKGFKKKRH
ncbi:unnamed protein product [Meganyctiphanes norvegica]|uniref:Neuroguidin n=1 Tax=Meganyctiphanes norvegica TaxID=48144 RepID=A0AAV2QL05_MEGNR